jgi:hypothetical protein
LLAGLAGSPESDGAGFHRSRGNLLIKGFFMKKNLIHMAQAIILTLSLMTFTGCIEVLGILGSGASMASDYILKSNASKTISHEFDRTKKALLIALRKMEIFVEEALEIEDGEQIVAKADKLEIKIELTEITSKVTRITVVAGKNIIHRDKATAQEIVYQTNKVADKIS